MSSEKNLTLKVTKHDKSVHYGPIENKDFFIRQNNQLPPEKQMKIEEVEMTEEEIANAKPFDENYIPVITKEVAKLQGEVADKDAEIEKLRAQLAEKENGGAKSNSKKSANA